MFNLVLLVIFVWGIIDILSGLNLLLVRTPILLVGMLLGHFKRKKLKLGYSKEELERMFMLRNPNARKDESGMWVDENNIPFL